MGYKNQFWEVVLKYRSSSCYLMHRKWQQLFSLLLFAALLTSMLWPRPAVAHGGVVIDSGFTDHFEWLVSIDPYPIETGQAMMTLLVFDLATYDPVSDLQVTVALAPPGTDAPVLQPGRIERPDPVGDRPAIYPGDYSERINLDQPGEWALQFVVEGGERSFTTIVLVPVKAAPVGQVLSPMATPDVAATATVFAGNVQAARQQNSPLPGPLSPLTTTVTTDMAAVTTAGPLMILGLRWWLWGIAALIPLVMGWLLWRTPQRQDDDDE